jgi:hypothetical protein
MGSDPLYDLGTFDLPHVDYVALGHIHKHQAMAYATPVVYAGSIDRVDFGEEQEEKGFVLVELPTDAKGRAEWEFRKVDARPFLTIEATVESDNATEDVVRAIARNANRLERAIVRLRVDIPPERVPELREDDIRAQLKAAYYVAPMERTARPRARNRWGADGAAIQRAGPLEALALYLEHQHVETARRDVLLGYARQLMAPESDALEAHLHAAAEPRTREPAAALSGSALQAEAPNGQATAASPSEPAAAPADRATTLRPLVADAADGTTTEAKHAAAPTDCADALRPLPPEAANPADGHTAGAPNGNAHGAAVTDTAFSGGAVRVDTPLP